MKWVKFRLKTVTDMEDIIISTLYDIGLEGAQIEDNQIDLVIFLREPLSPKMHEPDVNNIVRLCDMHNIPLATNLATAELLIKSLDRGDLEWREMYK